MSGTEDVKALSQQFVSRGHFSLVFLSSQVGAVMLSFLVGSAVTPRTFPLALACLEQEIAGWVQVPGGFLPWN